MRTLVAMLTAVSASLWEAGWLFEFVNAFVLG
jgi:hypothetical protein